MYIYESQGRFPHLPAIESWPLLLASVCAAQMAYLTLDDMLNPSSHAPFSHSESYLASTQIEHNVPLNQQTTLDRLYHYPPDKIIQYPETSGDVGNPIGHLFTMSDPAEVYNPMKDFAYSLGEPGSSGRSEVYVAPLFDENGDKVPCRRFYRTCQGAKICPYVPFNRDNHRHTGASRASLSLQLSEERNLVADSTPQQDIFCKTLALWVNLRDGGCPYEPQEQTFYSAQEKAINAQRNLTPTKARRGHDIPAKCQGRILMRWCHTTRKPYLACEHYCSDSKKHFINRAISDGVYNIEYLSALCQSDASAIASWEERAWEEGYGPLAACTYMRNPSSIKVNCPHPHRSMEDGTMYMTPMSYISCSSKITAYVPLPAHRHRCHKVLVVCRSPHSHPIPLPSTTPEPLKRDLQHLLQQFDHDLPDLTPRRFLRHPLFRSYIKKALMDKPFPMATDLHPSLANLDHLGSIINHAVKNQCPEGTGWSGALALYEAQNLTHSPSNHYIRVIEEMSWEQLERLGQHHDATDPLPLSSKDAMFRIIICISPQRSRDLLQATAVQSDIAFKRVTGYKEFELVSFDKQSLSSVVYCRALMNSQSAVAHKYLFDKLRLLVQEDTGKLIQYRHLHSPDLLHHRGIRHWGLDQDRGQAKGLGLHLQHIARHELSPTSRDLHEPMKTLAELTEYEHLHRLVRLCYVHVERNIKKAKVPESIKQDMRSLMCIRHLDWDGTLRRISQEGGIPGQEWIQDKIRSKFAFQAICHAQSQIPLEVWQAGDTSTNLSEGLHADVNREGVQCSLVGALRRSQHYDLMRLKSQQVHTDVGIMARNRPTTQILAQNRSIKRNSRRRTVTLNKADENIVKHNEQLRNRHDQITRLQDKVQALPNDSKVRQQLNKANATFQKQYDKSRALEGTSSGSGKEKLWFPSSSHPNK